MSGDLRLVNRQRTAAVDFRLLRKVLRSLLEEELGLVDFDLTVHLVNAREMVQLNRSILGHEGSTDVITLDYQTSRGTTGTAGELYVCLDEAVAQARRFGTYWQEEMVRYLVHGTLHLMGYDDHGIRQRRKMKKEESRLVRRLAAGFNLRKLQRKTKLRP